MDATMLHVGRVPQYFFDNVLIDQIQDIKRTVHRPRKMPEPVVRRDRPWEENLYTTVNGFSVLRDPTTGKFRCWYDDWWPDREQVKRVGFLYCNPGPTLYAESQDGINWVKPEFDYVVKDGRKTNIVIGKTEFMKLESTHVFEDPLDKDPNGRFKMFLDWYQFGRTSPIKGSIPDRIEAEVAKTRDGRDGLTDQVRVEIHSSPDGIHWTRKLEPPRFGRHGNGLGDCYTIFVDAENGLYRLITRSAGMESVHYDSRRPRTGSFFPPLFPHDEARMNRRRIFLSESSDLVHWSRPQCILAPDVLDSDNLDDSYYGMCHYKVGEMYVGFMNVLHQVDNTLDCRLVYSRDGWNWNQLDQRQPWMTTSPESWDNTMVNVSVPPVTVGDELYVYYGGAKNHHDWWITGYKEGLDVPEATSKDAVEYAIGLSKLRKDGFVSVDAGPVRDGVLITRALWTDAKKLVINAECGKGGYVRVEATDADENVLAGCSRDESDTFAGDSVAHTVSWRGKTDIPHGGSLRLRFFMKNASLYSITFA